MAQIGPLASLGVYAVLATLTIAVALMLARALQERRTTPLATRPAPYEGGIQPTGLADSAAMAPYFLVAAFFVIFDMEVAILFAWAIAAREAGWVGLVEAGAFIFVLLAALIYLWADGALDLGFRPEGDA